MQDGGSRAAPIWVSDAIGWVAAEDPTRPAILSASGEVAQTFASLADQIARISQDAAGLGLRPGDRVAILAGQGVESAVAVLSLTAQFTLIPLDPKARSAEVRDVFRRLTPQAVFALDGGLPTDIGAAIEAARVPVLELVPDAEQAGRLRLNGAPMPEQTTTPDPDDIALILETSGTTAAPKSVALTRTALASAGAQAGLAYGLNPGDICVNPMPLYHVHGLSIGLFAPLQAGSAVALTETRDGAAVLAACRATQATWYTGVPTIHHDVLAVAGADPGRLDGLNLRFIRSASSALPQVTRDGLERCFGVPVCESYAMTEAASWVTSQRVGRLCTGGTVGWPVDVKLAIFTADGPSQVAGAEGEVLIRGPNVIREYLSGGADAFHDGWLKTGDLGRLEADGQLTLLARIKELVNRGGEMISPVAVEAALRAQPGIADAIAFGTPHATLGQEFLAAVVPEDTAVFDVEGCFAGLAKTLPERNLPRRLLALDAIPCNRLGKPDRLNAGDRLADLITPAPEPPQGLLEPIVADMMAEVTGHAFANRHQDFFLSGGDSLAFTRLRLRLEDAFAVPIPLARTYCGLSAASLSHHIAEAGGDALQSLLAEVWRDLPGDDA